jgi:NhaP-type Na+/H+ or K+/H+ antiporter
MDSVLTNSQWFLLLGGLLLVRGLTTPLIRNWPVTTAMVYLAVGLLVGPTALNLFHFNPLEESALLEWLTEAAVLISLYAAGVKMPVPVSFARWRTPLMLGSVSMAMTVMLVAAFAHYALGLPIGAAVLFGAIVAPTDPVLATDVQVRHPGDRDRLRLALTCEAGINDGSAFPFIMLGMGLLGLHELGQFGLRWAVVDVLWATTAGIAIGVLCGSALAQVVHRLRGADSDHGLLDDFLGLGLIGVVYGLSVLASAWGFLAVFFAAVAVRQTEGRLASAKPKTAEGPHGHGAGRAHNLPDRAPTFSDGSLVFKEHLERLSELLLILLLGGMLFVDSWTWRAVATALFLFLVARPLGVLLALLGTRTPWRLRGLVGWFGVRGIGSLYYLMYAIQHGLPKELALELAHLTLIVVSMSIFVHGASVKPLMSQFWPKVQLARNGRSNRPV